MDYKLELVLVPVSDVDRARDFYTQKAGFNLDVDTEPAPGFRIVQMTPPGSACSITIGNALQLAEPGSLRGTHLVVTDVVAARSELAARGVDIGEVFHYGPGGQEAGPHPERADYGTFAAFADPDGNTWLLQEVPSRG